jgi:conjugative transfer pilus assembly protein TraH
MNFATAPFRTLVAALSLLALLTLPLQASAAGWTDDWIDQATTYSGSHYATDQRGYYGVGGFSMRNRMTNDYLVSVSPPRVEVGCGGVDLFGGAFSYLDPEYLVEKFERIVQAAPAFAFQTAMSEFCVQCINGMNTLTSIMDQLNSMQINDCRMSKRLVTAVAEDKNVFKELSAEALGKYSLDEGLSKNSQDVAEKVESAGGGSSEDTNVLIVDCPDVFREVFTNGSVLRNAAELIGMEGYADVMRGLIGDAIVTYDNSSKLFLVEKLDYCPANKDLDSLDLVDGTAEVKRIDGTCASAGMTSVRDLVRNRMMGIAAKVSPGGNAPLTPDEAAFVSRSPFPMVSLLGDASARGTLAEEVEVLADPLADLYAQRMLEDLHELMRFVVTKANTVGDQAGSARAGGNAKRCDTTVVKEAIVHFQSVKDRISRLRADAAVSFAKKQQERIANAQIVGDMLERRKRQLNKAVAGDR